MEAISSGSPLLYVLHAEMGEALTIVLTSPRNLDDLAQYCAKQEAGTMPTWTNAKLPSGRIALINLDNVSLIVPTSISLAPKMTRSPLMKLRKSCWLARRAPKGVRRLIGWPKNPVGNKLWRRLLLQADDIGLRLFQPAQKIR
jgi:hypothetical protein